MRIGIADTTFARVDMAKIAVKEIQNADPRINIERYTVPGFKDLPLAAKRLIEKYKCDIVLALGWVGKEDIDEVCAHEANIGLIQAELMSDRHILKVFFHEKEALNHPQKQIEIARDRVAKHALNAIALVKGKDELRRFAAKGRRQGYKDAGSLS